jgi:hypothetical protein
MAKYPKSSWSTYDMTLKMIGERRSVEFEVAEFLVEIGLVDSSLKLTDSGQSYFNARFIRQDNDEGVDIIQQLLLGYEPVMAMSQRLYGVPNVDKSIVGTLFRNVGLGEGLTDRNLGTLLAILSNFGVITYAKNKGEVVVLHPPLEAGTVPSTIFVSRETPFSNVMWLTRVLRECDEYIYWLDKHFQPAGLEALADASDGNRIKEVKILSLQLPANSSAKVTKAYQALKKELLQKGIQLEWRFIASSLVRDTHDRWVIGAISARNVPDVGTIMSGNKSEMSSSNNAERLSSDFLGYWKSGVEVA